MAFFLLGRTEDGTLSLLSDATFESRQDALAELGRMTADAAFDRWTDEVVLIDLESGVPVLLVRPAAPAVEPALAVPVALEPEPEPRPEPEPAAFAAIADAEPEPVVTTWDAEAIEIEEPWRDETHEPTPEDAAEPAGHTEPEELATAESADVVPAIPVPAPAVEPVPVPAVEPVPAPTVEPIPEPTPSRDADETGNGGVAAAVDEVEGMDFLRDAIARTTEQMQASGIVAPTSIGPAQEPASEPAADEKVEAEQPATSVEILVIPEPTPPAWPWATSSEESAAAGESAPESEPDVAFVLEGLEEPAFDAGGSLITSTIDDESLAASKPIILGAYDDDDLQVEFSAVTDDLDPADASDDSEAVPADIITPNEDSDFFELNPIPEPLVIEPAPAPLDSAAPEVSESPSVRPADGDDALLLSTYTCNDCIYVDTCPNKDERRPEDCGSFQWK